MKIVVRLLPCSKRQCAAPPRNPLHSTGVGGRIPDLMVWSKAQADGV
jgi:hypothetical protein